MRPKTAPNERLRALGGGVADAGSLSVSDTTSSFAASLRQSLFVALLVLLCEEDRGVEGTEGELLEDTAEVDECVEGTGDVDGLWVVSGALGPVRLGRWR